MPSERGFLRIGVTGGIGAGKSEVCAAFARKGRVVLSADAIARSVMEADAVVRKSVAAICGPDAYHADGTLNVPHVAAAIFDDAPRIEIAIEVFANIELGAAIAIIGDIATGATEQRAQHDRDKN